MSHLTNLLQMGWSHQIANYRHQVGVNTHVLRCRVLGYCVVVMKFAGSICHECRWILSQPVFGWHRQSFGRNRGFAEAPVRFKSISTTHKNTGLSTWKDAILKRKGVLVFQPSSPVTILLFTSPNHHCRLKERSLPTRLLYSWLWHIAVHKSQM